MILACALGALGLRIVLIEDEGGIPRQTAEMAAMSRRRPAKRPSAAPALVEASVMAPSAPAPALGLMEAA